MALVVAENTVAGIGEPDGAVRGDDGVVRRVEPLALEAVDQDRDRAVMLGAGHAPSIVLAGDQPALAIPGVAIAIVGRLAIDADMAVLLQPAHDPVVGDVAPQQVAAVPEIDRSFGPPEAGGDPLDGGIADLVPEALVQRLDTRVGIAGIGQISQRSTSARAGGMANAVVAAPAAVAAAAVRNVRRSMWVSSLVFLADASSAQRRLDLGSIFSVRCPVLDPVPVVDRPDRAVGEELGHRPVDLVAQRLVRLAHADADVPGKAAFSIPV